MADNGCIYRGFVGRTERITIRVPAALKQALERAAWDDRRSLADIIIPVLEDRFLPRKWGGK